MLKHSPCPPLSAVYRLTSQAAATPAAAAVRYIIALEGAIDRPSNYNVGTLDYNETPTTVG